MYIDNWRPHISFSYETTTLCIILSYHNDTSVKIQHPSWNTLINGFPSYNDVKITIKNYLFLDLKGRPAVHAFLRAGPPGDNDGNYDTHDIVELAELLASSIENKYYQFISHLN
jgi:hypothetical protein